MNAVRSEVEELKEKIIKLEEVISQLQSENEFLRANVNRDVLLQFQQQQQQQQAALGSPPGPPALSAPPPQPSI
jgi:regulator of replication initiation timing